MRRTALLLLACAGCDDNLWGVSGEPITETGYAGVQAIAEASCTTCHSAASAQGALDLETDLHNAVVSRPSSIDPAWTLVTPGDTETSLLYHLVVASPPPGFRVTDMPPGSGGLSTDEATIIENWILDGAPDL